MYKQYLTLTYKCWYAINYDQPANLFVYQYKYLIKKKTKNIS